MARLPEGDPAPPDGLLPPAALATVSERSLGVYVHVPFCSSRCGYCDFNTYVPGEREAEQVVGYADAVIAELKLAARVLGSTRPPASTLYVGGGTPTLLAAAELAGIVEGVRDHVGLAADAEVTTEANPDSVTPASLAELHAAGFSRISFGMQSAVPHVLAALDRTHTPGRPAEAVREAFAAGFTQVSLDLIYGTPGETDADWEESLAVALAAKPTHVSAYSLIVEPGTLLAAQVRRGDVVMPDEDVAAARFERADRVLEEAGLRWYETCSWAVDEAAQSQHNLGYWTGENWWGVGPGAHSHIGGVRWANVLHPRTWAQRLKAGRSPGATREAPDAEAVRLERVMLGLRLVDGVDLVGLSPVGREGAVRYVAEGLLDGAAFAAGRAVLTRQGRLRADMVTLALVA